MDPFQESSLELTKRYSTVYIDGVKMSDPSSSDNSFYFSNIMNSSIKNVRYYEGLKAQCMVQEL